MLANSERKEFSTVMQFNQSTRQKISKCPEEEEKILCFPWASSISCIPGTKFALGTTSNPRANPTGHSQCKSSRPFGDSMSAAARPKRWGVFR
jgi:hypothetical protein